MSGAFARLAAGLAAAAAVWATGLALERQRFGATDQIAVERIEGELANRFAEGAATLAALAAPLVDDAELVTAAARDVAAARRLFGTLEGLLPERPDRDTGITVYGPGGQPVAWAGRVSDLPDERVIGPAALFVAPGALGPRLVRVEPVHGADRTARSGSVVVEQLLGELRVTPSYSDTFELSTSLVPVSLRARLGAPPDDLPFTFVIPASDGQLLVEARVDPTDLSNARQQWRRAVWGAVLLIMALTLLAAGAPALRPACTESLHRSVTLTVALIALIVGVYAVVRLAALLLIPPPASTLPLLPAVSGLALAAIVWLLLDLVERWRLTRLPLRRSTGARAASGGLVALAGAFGTALLWRYQQLLASIGGDTASRLLDFSLYPVDVARLGSAFGLVLLHAAVVWSAALLLRTALVAIRRPRNSWLTVWLPYAAGVLLVVVVLWRASDTVLPAPLLVVMGTVGLCATSLTRVRGSVRRSSQAARLGAFFLALLVPALSIYPTLYALATDTRERLVAEVFAPQAINLRDDLQERLRGALETIDALPSLEAFIGVPSDDAGPASDEAFSLWSRTDLAAFRLTSAVELYAADGSLASRFALNLPEYSAETTHVAASCDWELIEEVSPFGSSERHVLRASRAVCGEGRRLGSVVVRAMLDYRTLPFISSESPYLEALGPASPLEGVGVYRDLEFVMYGWSRAPIQTSATSVWALPDAVFERMVASRAPIWETVRRDDTAFRVHFLNDRGGIYALGYPTVTTFGHLVNLAELTTLSGIVFVLLLGAAGLASALSPRPQAGGRVLLREIRSSFYRTLFIAFVSAAVVPVVVLALATRAYFASEFLAGIEQSAVQTAAVAQRLVEDYAALQEMGSGDREVLDDQIMMVVARAIGQAVNLFDRETLQATSERDLFASGLLPTRTPSEVYRAIVIDRMPMFVGEEAIGGSGYLLAAAPVRAGGREGIVTVPQTLRRQEIEDQIDELDRRVLFASVLFVLVGAGIGYWMAERIADPVNRLTRATRRIARGDLNARVVATSSDELRRLVEDFNRMADDLQRQRAELERTQRLEAWAEMARQVAHDIKNPLTPIQLSAEHARRVNQDKGAPLSPVLDSCVDAILRQVTLLRQIAAEFSSFASSPAARPEPSDLAALLEDVVASYRTGLTGRVAIQVVTAPDLPRVSIDRTLCARALTNIVENALHAMPGGGALTLEAKRADGSGVIVTITDTGIGMDPEARARIFEPYFSTRATGTGLGLTIAKRNVELLGGTIDVQSERGVGTTVTIRIGESKGNDELTR